MSERSDSKFLMGFAVFLVVLSAAYIGCITFVVIPKENQNNANTVLGFLLGTLIGTLISFFYGSSKASQTKDATINAMAAAAAPSPPTPDSQPVKDTST